MTKPKVVFISFMPREYSRGGTFTGGETQGYFVDFFQFERGIISIISQSAALRKTLKKENTFVVVLSPSQLILPVIRLLCGVKVYLDAGWTLTESSLARKSGIFTIVKNFAIDFVAMQMANLVFLESNAQIDWTAKYFLLRRRKLRRIFTGCNESYFGRGEASNSLIVKLKAKASKFDKVVFFRGKWNAESGIPEIIEVSRHPNLKDVLFIIVTDRIAKETLHETNLVIIRSFVSVETIRGIYQLSDIALGQLTSHPRLRNTIPHKAFEAAYFGKAFICIDSQPLRELFPIGNEVCWLADSTNEAIVDIIKALTQDPLKLKVLGSNIQKSYRENASQAVLQQEFVNSILHAER
jgi:hypothetical protein